MAPKKEHKDFPVPPPPADDAAAEAKAHSAEVKALTELYRASSWSLHRWPLEKQLALERTRLHLPRTYLNRNGSDTRIVYEGEDLNQVVFQYYLEQVEKEKTQGWINFVHDDKVVSRRHEYLGPDPRVAGYVFDAEGDAHIRWWDEFLRDQWMEKQKWKVSVTKQDDGGWAEKL